MGNTNTTNLDIKPFFGQPIQTSQREIAIKINSRDDYKNIIVRSTASGDMAIDLAEPDSKFDYEWTPKSHLRDFETIDPFTAQALHIGRKNGLGILIIEPLETYIKLVYDETLTNGIKCAVYCIWNHSSETFSLLNKDLGLGYDVLFIDSDFNYHHLCEEIDERDKKETLILFKELEHLA